MCKKSFNDEVRCVWFAKIALAIWKVTGKLLLFVSESKDNKKDWA